MYVPFYLSGNKPMCYFTPCLLSLLCDITYPSLLAMIALSAVQSPHRHLFTILFCLLTPLTMLDRMNFIG